MRKVLVAATLIAVPLLGLGAPSAMAYCDPDYRPLCMNDCHRPDVKDPLGSLFRMCPD